MQDEQSDKVVLQCSCCKNYYETQYCYLCTEGPDDGKITCVRCARIHFDPFTDPELNYRARRNMTDQEARTFNSSWLKAHRSVQDERDSNT